MLDDAAEAGFTVVRVVWRDRLAPGSPVARIDRYLSEVGVTVGFCETRASYRRWRS
jgi:hypothetical protein